MKRLEEAIIIVLVSAIAWFVIGATLSVISYSFNHLADWEWRKMSSFAVDGGSGLARIYGASVFLYALIVLTLFEGSLQNEDYAPAFALAYSIVLINIGVLNEGNIFMSCFTLFLLLFGLIGTAFLVWQRLKNESKPEPVGIIFETTRDGLPALDWSQLVATQDTLASENARGRFVFYLGFVAVCTVLAFGATGDLAHALVILLLSSWFGLFALRGAGSLKMQGQALGAVPHVKTETERREEMIPVTKREDCQAYLEIADNQIWFCIARGDKTKGPLELAERVPWDSFSNFEEGSHKQWFRGRGSVSDLADWGVIVAQSSVGRVVRVAESVHEQAWLVELLVTLQNTFIAPRDAMIRLMREAAQANGRAQSKASDPGTSEQYDVPNKQF